MKNIYTTILLIGCILVSCETEFTRIFKQHLYSKLLNVEEVVDAAVEGNDVGQHKIGSKDVINKVIDEGYSIYWNENSTQEQVDGFCGELDNALEIFNKSVNPSTKGIRDFVEYAENLIDGMEEDNDVLALKNKINEINDLLANTPASDLENDIIETLEQDIINLISVIENRNVEPVNVNITNPSFEPSVSQTDAVITDFSLFPGWINNGYVDGLKPWSGLRSNCYVGRTDWMLTDLQKNEKLDGDYALYVHYYSKEVWQSVPEFIHKDFKYKISFNLTISQWHEKYKNDIKFLFQIRTLKDDINTDFSNSMVLFEEEINNISSTELGHHQIEYIPEDDTVVGKWMIISLRAYYLSPVSNNTEINWTIQNGPGVLIDNLIMTREKL